MAEKVYLDEIDVKVTDAELVVSGQTIPMERIESADQNKEQQLGCLPNLLMGLGLLIVLSSILQGIEAAVLGVAMMAGGVVWYRRLRPNYYILLTTVEGKVRALDTKDKARVDRVQGAIQKALKNE